MEVSFDLLNRIIVLTSINSPCVTSINRSHGACSFTISQLDRLLTLRRAWETVSSSIRISCKQHVGWISEADETEPEVLGVGEDKVENLHREEESEEIHASSMGMSNFLN